jgi:hypothetical protein
VKTTVGVGLAATVVGDVDAADDEREVRFEAVEVKPVSDAERERGRLRRGGHGGLVLGLDGGRDGRGRPLPEAQGRPGGGRAGRGGAGAGSWRGGDGGRGQEEGGGGGHGAAGGLVGEIAQWPSFCWGGLGEGEEREEEPKKFVSRNYLRQGEVGIWRWRCDGGTAAWRLLLSRQVQVATLHFDQN